MNKLNSSAIFFVPVVAWTLWIAPDLALAQSGEKGKPATQQTAPSSTVDRSVSPANAKQAAANQKANAFTIPPELTIAPNATEAQLEEVLRFAKKMQPQTPDEYFAMQTAIRKASDALLKLMPDKNTARGQQAQLDALTCSVSLMAADGPEGKHKTLKNVKEYLSSRKVLSLADVQMGILAATFLEMQPNKVPARETFELLVDLLRDDAREEMQALRQNLLANIRRLNLLGSKFDLSANSLEGGKISIESYAGKFVIVDFFATWCEPCLAEVPRIRGHLEKYREKGLAVIGVSLDEKEDELKKYLDKAKLPWPIIHDAAPDPIASLRMKFGVANLPTVLLLNKEGVVVSLEARGPELDRLMQRLFEQPTPAEPTPAEPTPASKQTTKAAAKPAAK